MRRLAKNWFSRSVDNPSIEETKKKEPQADSAINVSIGSFPHNSCGSMTRKTWAQHDNDSLKTTGSHGSLLRDNHQTPPQIHLSYEARPGRVQNTRRASVDGRQHGRSRKISSRSSPGEIHKQLSMASYASYEGTRYCVACPNCGHGVVLPPQGGAGLVMRKQQSYTPSGGQATPRDESPRYEGPTASRQQMSASARRQSYKNSKSHENSLSTGSSTLAPPMVYTKTRPQAHWLRGLEVHTRSTGQLKYREMMNNKAENESQERQEREGRSKKSPKTRKSLSRSTPQYRPPPTDHYQNESFEHHDNQQISSIRPHQPTSRVKQKNKKPHTGITQGLKVVGGVSMAPTVQTPPMSTEKQKKKVLKVRTPSPPSRNTSSRASRFWRNTGSYFSAIRHSKS